MENSEEHKAAHGSGGDLGKMLKTGIGSFMGMFGDKSSNKSTSKDVKGRSKFDTSK